MPTNLRSSRKEELVVSFISESSIKENICNIVVKIQNHSLHIAWSFLETLCVYIHVYKICMCMSIPIYKFCVYMQKQLQNMRFPTFIYFDLVSYPPPPCQKKTSTRKEFLFPAYYSFANLLLFKKALLLSSQMESSNKAFLQNSKM